MADIEKQKKEAQQVAELIASVPEEKEPIYTTVIKAFADGMAAQRSMDEKREAATA